MVPKQHKAAQVAKAGGQLEVRTIDTPTPGPNQVIVKVSASGICFSDHFAVNGVMPGVPYPMSPGHEIVGRIAALGSNVNTTQWSENQLVGVGWNGGYCTVCPACRLGDFTACSDGRVTGINLQGGHQEYVAVDSTALVKLPENSGMKLSEMAPLLCAGNTVWEGLLASGAKPGDVVVISGLGGLGHLAIQYAAKLGFVVVAVSGSKDKADLAKKLGAHYYFAASDNIQEEVQKLGGARAIIATAPSSKAISDLVPLLGRYGQLVVLGVPTDGKDIQVPALALVSKRAGVQGMSCGAAGDNEKTIKFSALNGVKSMVTEWKLEDAHKAYLDVIEGKPKFRNVIVFD